MAETSYAPLSIRGRMADFTDVEKTGLLGVATECVALSDQDMKVFVVWTTPQRRHDVSLAITRGDNGNILSLFGACSCGQPQIQQFPCKHMDAAAVEGQFDERMLLPIEFTTARWKAQYPAGHTFFTTTKDELMVAGSFASLRDRRLRVPVTAPTKRGRPLTKRAKSAVERSVGSRLNTNQNRCALAHPYECERHSWL